MEQKSFCLSSLLVASVVLLVQSLVSDEQSKLHFYRSKRAVSCPLPLKYLTPGAILKWRNGGNESTFHPGDKAEFVCKKGYRQIGWLKSFICQEDGSWKRSASEQNGYCITNHCNGSKSFNCKDGSKSIDICHKCDCVADCDDASDELSCDAILVNVTGHATGILKYPYPSPEKSTQYTGSLKCSRTLWTDDPRFYIKLAFKNFSLSSDCKSSYVSLESTVFSDFNKSPDCCQQIDNSSCQLGGNTLPPLARSVANWLTVMIVASASESPSLYRLQWFNVNGLFPNGSIPSGDPPYPTAVVVPKATTNPSSESTDIKDTLAIVLFTVILFIAAWFTACMVGKRLIGPRCSFTYLRAMISAPMHRRSRRASHVTRDDPLARSPLTLDTDSPFVGERVSGRMPDNRSLSSMSSNYGSTENVV